MCVCLSNLPTIDLPYSAGQWLQCTPQALAAGSRGTSLSSVELPRIIPTKYRRLRIGPVADLGAWPAHTVGQVGQCSPIATVPEIHSRLYKFIYNGTYA